MNLCLLVVDHDIIDPFTVVMVVKPEEIIGTSAVLRFHLAVILHIRDQNIDQFVVVLADLAKSHRIIVEGSFLIMLRYIVMVQVDHRLTHISEIKLNAGEIRNHQTGFPEHLLIIDTGMSMNGNRRNNLYRRILIKIIDLRADDRMKYIDDLITVSYTHLTLPTN